jgi:hypothetical protein
MYREKALSMLPIFDKAEVRIVEETVNNAIRYCSTVTAMEAQLEILPYRCSPEELREEVTRLDINRRRAHDAFISRVNVTNRLCAKHNLPAFYDGPDDRYDIGECAFQIQKEYDEIRQLLAEPRQRTRCLK